jgi:hypothetical protein
MRNTSKVNNYSNSNKLKDFLDFEVYPSLFRRLDQAFPEFGLICKSNHWEGSNRKYTKGTWGVILYSPCSDIYVFHKIANKARSEGTECLIMDKTILLLRDQFL